MLQLIRVNLLLLENQTLLQLGKNKQQVLEMVEYLLLLEEEMHQVLEMVDLLLLEEENQQLLLLESADLKLLLAQNFPPLHTK